jgi:Flp pilus assembly protein TadD
MSKTLSLIDRLLLLARNCQKAHQDRTALGYLTRLAALPDLPADLAEEVQARLGEMQVQRRRFRRARRHLAIALLYRPENVRYHNLMAEALMRGRFAEPARAIEHYRQSLELDSDQPDCRADLGRLLVRQGQMAAGLAELRKAAEQSPDDPDIVKGLIWCLCRARRPREALAALRAARFHNPHDDRFRQLYNAFRFRRLRARQRAERRSESIWNNGDGAVLLPFVLPDATSSAGKVRQDDPQALPGPHRSRSARRSDRKHG